MLLRRSLIPLLMMIGGVILIGAAILWALSLYSNPAPTFIQGSEASYPDIARVSVADAKQALDRNQAIIVDVREAKSYDERHIGGAVSIPLNELPKRLSELKRETWIITYCA